MTDTEITGRLENWSYDPLWHCIWGDIYEDVHKRWEEGEKIHTSHITTGDRKALRDTPPSLGDIISTLNSRYLLGVPKEPNEPVFADFDYIYDPNTSTWRHKDD